jgi:hypothetical protein
VLRRAGVEQHAGPVDLAYPLARRSIPLDPVGDFTPGHRRRPGVQIVRRASHLVRAGEQMRGAAEELLLTAYHHDVAHDPHRTQCLETARWQQVANE